MHTSTTSNFFYCQRIIFFLMANFFDGLEYEEVKERYSGPKQGSKNAWGSLCP